MNKPPGIDIDPAKAIVTNWNEIERWALNNDALWHRVHMLTQYWPEIDRLRFICASLLHSRADMLEEQIELANKTVPWLILPAPAQGRQSE